MSVGEPQDLRGRGRLGLEVAQQVASVGEDAEACLQVDELRRDVVAGDRVGLHGAERPELIHRPVEPLGRDAQRELPRLAVLRGRGEDEPAVGSRDAGDRGDVLGELARRNDDLDASVADDLRQVALGLRASSRSRPEPSCHRPNTRAPRPRAPCGVDGARVAVGEGLTGHRRGRCVGRPASAPGTAARSVRGSLGWRSRMRRPPLSSELISALAEEADAARHDQQRHHGRRDRGPATIAPGRAARRP